MQNVKSFLIGLCASSIFSLSVLTVSAESVSAGRRNYYTVSGIEYENYNIIKTGSYSGRNNVITTTVVHSNVPTPAGYVGVKPVLYNSYGNVVESGEWTYQQVSGVNHYRDSVSVWDVSLSYNGCGYTAAWNGSSYYTYSTYQTENLSDFT